jgi:tetratricopeptide (TPR) repeat protein
MAANELRNVKYYKEEIAKNEAILAENPNDYRAVKALALIYSENLFHDERAFHYLERAFALNPNDEIVMDRLSYYRQKFGDTEGARELDEKFHWENEE